MRIMYIGFVVVQVPSRCAKRVHATRREGSCPSLNVDRYAAGLSCLRDGNGEYSVGQLRGDLAAVHRLREEHGPGEARRSGEQSLC